MDLGSSQISDAMIDQSVMSVLQASDDRSAMAFGYLKSRIESDTGSRAHKAR